jgi:hypothetical protein
MPASKKSNNFFWFRAVGASFAGAVDRERLSKAFVRISAARGDVARERCQDQKTKTSRSSNIQSVGVDLTEEKRHASPITRVVKFGQ